MSWERSNSGSATLRPPGLWQPQHDEHQPGQQRATAAHQAQPEQRRRRQPRESPHMTLLHPHRKMMAHFGPQPGPILAQAQKPGKDIGPLGDNERASAAVQLRLCCHA